MEKNGHTSSSKMTRHINVWYLFVTNQIKLGDIKIKYSPTLDIIGDYFSKPFQGSLFRRFHNLILGIEEADVNNYNTKSHEWIKEKKQKNSNLTKSIKAGV